MTMLVKVDGLWYEVIERNYAKGYLIYFDHLENREEIISINGLYLQDGHIDDVEFHYSRYINEGD